jgi:hypothetical protein
MIQRLPILLLLVGCGGLTNTPFLEDEAFSAALPSADRARITIETAGQDGRRTRLDRLWMLGLTLNVSSVVNSYVQRVLSAVDDVRTRRPDGRGDDWRRWGPYPFRGDQEITGTMARDGATYAWRFDIDPTSGGEGTRPVYGEHIAGDAVQSGVGTMNLDLDAWAAAGFGAITGTATVAYDLRDGRTMRITLEGVADVDGGDTEDTEIWFSLHQGQQGRFEYDAQDDINNNGVLEDLLVVTRWIPGGAGRADAEVSGGDAEGYAWRVTQCWGANAELVYEADNLGVLETVGAEADCIYPDRATATHL